MKFLYGQVHHVNGNGEDAGVLYNEVMDTESDPRKILENRYVIIRRLEVYDADSEKTKTNGTCR